MAEFYMRDIRAWRDSTIKLTFEEQGYFSALLDLIYIYHDCLIDDDDLICRAMPVNKKVHLRLKKRLIENGFIKIQSGFYFNSRSTQELLKINSKSVQNKLKADKRWAKSRKTKEMVDAVALQRQCEGESEGESEDNNPDGLLRAYKFEGNVIRLNFKDYDKWKQSYHAIPDFDAQLQSADDWISGESDKNQKRWFHVISSMLGKKHQQYLTDAKKEMNGSKKGWML